jgi:hypothetical protein
VISQITAKVGPWRETLGKPNVGRIRDLPVIIADEITLSKKFVN